MEFKPATKEVFIWALIIGLGVISSFSCSGDVEAIHFSSEGDSYILESKDLKVFFSNSMECRLVQNVEGEAVTIVKSDQASHYLVVNDQAVEQYLVDPGKTNITSIDTEFGTGKRLTLVGTSPGPRDSRIEKTLNVEMYERFPSAAVMWAEYRNASETKGLLVNREVNASLKLDAGLANPQNSPHDFWILQGGTVRGSDWILPVTDGFSFENYQGQGTHPREVGGGVPLLDVWCPETGIFVGSLATKPKLLSLPAHVDDDGSLEIAVVYERNVALQAKPYSTLPVAVGVHGGDFYDGAKLYASMMDCRGLQMQQPPPEAYEAIWCGWGFGPDFTPQQMIDMIPVAKDLGIRVATIDMGWFEANGDFAPRKETFPNGEEDMKRLVEEFHEEGFLVKLWITPCLAGPKLLTEHPEWLLQDENGDPLLPDIYLPRGDSAWLCPSVPAVHEYYRELIGKMVSDWGIDGFKMDLHPINTIERCFNKDHHHVLPEESVETLPEIYRTIRDVTQSVKSYGILELCPCNTFPSLYKMPYYNQSVASDPHNQWQVRHRGKVLKAIMGSSAAYYGDHVELQYHESNFASMIGVGGIPGTMFVINIEDGFMADPALTSERREIFKKWIGLYNRDRLSTGEYLNLYDIAFDKPEAHVIRKNGALYYAFFAEQWAGPIEFRGLDDREYVIRDYVNDRELGELQDSGSLEIKFEDYLLAKADPR
jgi:alpha-galactosidase